MRLIIFLFIFITSCSIDKAETSNVYDLSDAVEIVHREDGDFDVRCKDGTQIIATKDQVQMGNICKSYDWQDNQCSGESISRSLVSSLDRQEFGKFYFSVRIRQCFGQENDTAETCRPWESINSPMNFVLVRHASDYSRPEKKVVFRMDGPISAKVIKYENDGHYVMQFPFLSNGMKNFKCWGYTGSNKASCGLDGLTPMRYAQEENGFTSIISKGSISSRCLDVRSEVHTHTYGVKAWTETQFRLFGLFNP